MSDGILVGRVLCSVSLALMSVTAERVLDADVQVNLLWASRPVLPSWRIWWESMRSRRDNGSWFLI